MNNTLSILDYFFFFLVLGCFLNIILQFYIKYVRINTKIDNDQLVNKYIKLQNILKKRKMND